MAEWSTELSTDRNRLREDDCFIMVIWTGKMGP